MLLETFKSLVARFKKHKPSTEENVTQPTLSYPPSTGTQPSLNSQIQTLTVPGPAPTPGFFPNAHHNVLNNPTMVSVSNTFDSGGGAIMQLLESKTIQGAEHDSSARYPPPKCHPNTRHSLRGLISDWILNPKRSWRMFYVLGPAGVGKSAVAQTVADDCKEADCLGASCFISRPNHRNDPNGIIPTLAYQLAVKHDVYKRIISQKLAHDPTILRKTRRVQFKELLSDPFHIIMTQDISAIHNPLLIIIDGLDECESEGAQCEFIELISDHTRSFPEFPLLWLICSRPEWHLKYTMSQADFQVTCRREEISVDDEEGRQDVLMYLRSEFRNIRLQHPDTLDYNWPPESHVRRIAMAASGLFAFASTVIRFVGDANAGDPSSQLRVCINILGGSYAPLDQNPYHALDLLYRHILTSIPPAVRATTTRILGMFIFYPNHFKWYDYGTLLLPIPVQTQANFLRIRKAAFYHALKWLHSVLRIPSSSDAFTNPIKFYHASFGDFLRDPGRSGEFWLDAATVHYDVAFAALRWHTDSTYEKQTDEFWISPSGDVQGCLENIKSQSLFILWRACSRVKGRNAMNLYTEFREFDFNVLPGRIPGEWEFGDFLSWFNRQQRRLPWTQKLLRFQSCHKGGFYVAANVTVPLSNISDLVPGEFSVPKKTCLTLGNENKCRHLHIDIVPEMGGTQLTDVGKGKETQQPNRLRHLKSHQVPSIILNPPHRIQSWAI